MFNQFRIMVILSMFIFGSIGHAMSHQKIVYTVEINGICKNLAKNFLIYYDGDNLLRGHGRDLGYQSSRSYRMPMIIPDVAKVTWKTVDGQTHEEKIPLRSLVRPADTKGSEFTVAFNVCDAKLYVYLDKDIGQFETKRKQLWTNQKMTKVQ